MVVKMKTPSQGASAARGCGLRRQLQRHAVEVEAVAGLGAALFDVQFEAAAGGLGGVGEWWEPLPGAGGGEAGGGDRLDGGGGGPFAEHEAEAFAGGGAADLCLGVVEAAGGGAEHRPRVGGVGVAVAGAVEGDAGGVGAV